MVDTRLHEAVRAGNIPAIQDLLKKGVDVNGITDGGETPLHAFIDDYIPSGPKDKCMKILDILINAGADVNLMDDYGKTALTCVLDLGFFHVPEEFNILDPVYMKNFLEQCRQGTAEFNDPDYLPYAEVLIKAGADVNVVVNLAPLHFASWKGDLKVMEFLLSHGADVNIKDPSGLTPLFHVMLADVVEKKNFKCLLKYGADVDVRDSNGRTALMRGIQATKRTRMDENALSFFVDYFDINVVDSSGKNLLNLGLPFDLTKIVLEHIAKLQAVESTVHPSLLKTVENTNEYKKYFEKCKKELIKAKTTKIGDYPVTFFNVLVDSERKTEVYMKMKNFRADFKEAVIDKEIFPIYKRALIYNGTGGIDRQEWFEKCLAVMSNFLPILHSTDSIIRDIVYCLEKIDMKDMCKQ